MFGRRGADTNALDWKPVEAVLAVFGERRFCPVCGKLRAMVVALNALSAESARLDGLGQMPAQTAASLREQGDAPTRIAVIDAPDPVMRCRARQVVSVPCGCLSSYGHRQLGT